MKSLKTFGLIALVLVSTLGLVTAVYAKPRWIEDLTLQYNPDMAGWVDMGGALKPGFVLYLDPTVDYFYLDIKTISPLHDTCYWPFYIKTAPKGPYYKFWAEKSVTGDAAPGSWQEHMWKIITGEEPMFYLKSDCTNCYLIDGLLQD